ncbi:DUF6457 domain-containing protein [Kytococcus sp. Marseille-QA3725]
MAEDPVDLDGWIHDLSDALGVDAPVPSRQLLDVTREAAHGVTKVAGPLTTYLIGHAVAGGASVDEAVAAVERLVEQRRH